MNLVNKECQEDRPPDLLGNIFYEIIFPSLILVVEHERKNTLCVHYVTYLRQVAKRSTISTVKISSRPNNIENIIIHFAGNGTHA